MSDKNWPQRWHRRVSIWRFPGMELLILMASYGLQSHQVTFQCISFPLMWLWDEREAFRKPTKATLKTKWHHLPWNGRRWVIPSRKYLCPLIESLQTNWIKIKWRFPGDILRKESRHGHANHDSSVWSAKCDGRQTRSLLRRCPITPDSMASWINYTLRRNEQFIFLILI